ncbi:XRE family transcriptional regulator [Sideroxydans lithotrophicus]|uniref:Transcriptional regulator, XRE family n=1 Tax=Sideroxydans lithotrophicus (strain ES-1) TaxID=580332 RepID=D5CMJ2_SIDLE|nr:XRE family transcriptional regulator [Sideroxydans lithotrophicus]ADE12664.1 transcriptional regulator, XRE family [Sideroxydans lithotrophicus ES-1]
MEKLLNSAAIQSALAERGITQKQLASEVGTSSQAVTNWLKGKDFPRPASLLKLATTLGLTFDQLVLTNDVGRPVIAYRKKANAKTTDAHIAKAEGIGMLLKPLVTHLPELQALRTLITSPSTEYDKLQIIVSQTRSRLGLGEQAVLAYENLIGEFKDCGAILVPVLWGAKGNHENALHIRLPQEDVTFIFLNLDTRLEDFKFWMAHELAHVLTPELSGKNEGEDFADAFAGALLYPKACAEQTYRAATQQTSLDRAIEVLWQQATAHMISLNTVFQQVQRYAKANNLMLLPIEEKYIHTVRNSLRGPLVSETMFDPMPPSPQRYIAACEKTFQTGFFQALKRMIHVSGTGASYVRQVLDTSLQDASALYEELIR